MSKMKELDIELDHILAKADPFRCEKSKKKTKAEIEDWSRRYCHAIIENSTVFRSDINPKATQAILDTLIKEKTSAVRRGLEKGLEKMVGQSYSRAEKESEMMYGSELERLISKIPVLYQTHYMARKLVLSKEETLSQMLIMLSKEYLNVQSELIKIKMQGKGVAFKGEYRGRTIDFE